MVAGRALIHQALPLMPRVTKALADRGYRALAAAATDEHAELEIYAPPPGQAGFQPVPMAWRVEATFAQLGRWRRLSRCFEGSVESATAWLQLACVGYLLGRASL